MIAGPFVDTHCHLDVAAFDAGREAVIARARAAGIACFINPGYDVASSRRAIALAEQRDDVFAAVGIHPNDAATFDQDLPALRGLAAHSQVVAIGEIGLDYYWDRVPRDRQADAFACQLALARELGKPVIIHCRDAYDDTLEALRRHGDDLRVVMHAFAGDRRHADEALSRGYYLGLGGPITYKTADNLRAVAQAAPLDRLVLETDSPYLPPHPFRGQRNEPAYLSLISEKLSQVRGVSLPEVAAATTRAAQQLFGSRVGSEHGHE